MWGEVLRGVSVVAFCFLFSFGASKALCESWREFLALLWEVSALKPFKVKFSGFIFFFLIVNHFFRIFISEKSQNQGSRFDMLKTRPRRSEVKL